MSISAFEFTWENVRGGYWEWIETLRDEHAEFNRRFAAAFPKLLYNSPYSSYTDASFGIRSRIQAVGETTLSPSDTRNRVIQIARDCGINGNESDIRFTQHTIEEFENGAQLHDPGDTFEDWRRKLLGKPFPDNLLLPTDIPIWAWALGGVALIVLLRD